MVGCESSGLPLLPPGAYCTSSERCETGVCKDNFCAVPCTSPDDCTELSESTCGVHGYCALRCDIERYVAESLVCVDGAWTPCSDLDDS